MLDRTEVHRAGRDDSLQMCFSGKAALPGGEQNSKKHDFQGNDK